MADLTLRLHLRPDDRPRLDGVEMTTLGTAVAEVGLAAKFAGPSLFASPRTLRAWAEALLDVADEACRQEAALTDEPLPFTSAQQEADSRSDVFLERERDERIRNRTFKTGEAWT